MLNKALLDKRAAASGAIEQRSKRPPKKMTEYGKQLGEKQKVKHMYGLRERQFRRFFATALKMDGAPGENLLSLLERRLDNTVYRLKMTTSRDQARQLVVHGHILVNGNKVTAPSYLTSVTDTISLKQGVVNRPVFMEQVVEKRLKTGIKVPEWLELDRKNYLGKVLRHPVRADIQVPIEEHLIVELYSK